MQLEIYGIGNRRDAYGSVSLEKALRPVKEQILVHLSTHIQKSPSGNLSDVFSCSKKQAVKYSM